MSKRDLIAEGKALYRSLNARQRAIAWKIVGALKGEQPAQREGRKNEHR
ncbi:MAG: hypothetical protein RIE74_11050 [Pseudomonadales bacterium]